MFEARREKLMDEEFEGPSKTKRKQAMDALQKLGVEIVALNKSQIAQLKLPEQLLDAVLEAKRLTKHEAIRRQMQYIGKIMRGVEPEPIQRQLDIWNGVSQQATAQLHNLERWRTRLVADDAALSEFLSEHPGCDAQQLRTLIRNTRKEQAANRPPASYRALFRWLRDTLQVPPEETDDAEDDVS